MFGRARGAMRLRAVGLALVLFVATACDALGGGSNDAGPGNGLEKSRIKLVATLVVDIAPVWLAQTEGFFAAEGLTVDIDIVDLPGKTLVRAISGEDDIAFTTWTGLFIEKSQNVHDFRVVADGAYATPKSNVIVVVPNSPVKYVKDLAGKRIGITSKNAASQILTESVMRDHGVDYKGVQWTQIALPNMADALRRGDLDAAYQPEPWATAAAKSVGATSVADAAAATSSTENFPLVGYAATGDWVTANPKTMAAFQRAMFNASRFASDTLNRPKLEAAVVREAKVDPTVAALMTPPGYGSTMDARRLQRVPDLLESLGALTAHIDAAPMIVPQYAG